MFMKEFQAILMEKSYSILSETPRVTATRKDSNLLL